MFSEVPKQLSSISFILQGDATLSGDHLPVRLLPAGQQSGRQTCQLDPGDVQVPCTFRPQMFLPLIQSTTVPLTICKKTTIYVLNLGTLRAFRILFLPYLVLFPKIAARKIGYKDMQAYFCLLMT
jgi:hypothetical protein